MSRYVAEGKKLTKKDWAKIVERLCCCDDLLELFHQNNHLSHYFKNEVRDIQQAMISLENRIYKKSLTKKERKEIYGK